MRTLRSPAFPGNKATAKLRMTLANQSSDSRPLPFPDAGLAAPAQNAGDRILLLVFVLALFMPVGMEIAGLMISPMRLLLLLASVPLGVRLLSGQFGGVTRTDVLFLLHGAWIFVALIAVHGTQRIPFAGITAVEIVGGYIVGRALVRSAADYRRMFRIILISLICMMPLAVFENLTGKQVIFDILRPIFDYVPERDPSAYGRMGLERVYGVFEHAILWGLFCSLTLANLVMMSRGSPVKITLAIGFSLYTTMLSLSSAPLLSCAMQLMLLCWYRATGGHWKLLLGLAVLGYAAVDLLSNRSPLTVLISYLTFNPLSGYIRIHIFDYGWAAVMGSPIVGIGFNEWPKPSWLTSSVDNFWLLEAMRYGLVGAVMLVGAIVVHIWNVARAPITDPDIRRLRIGHVITLAGACFTLATVHVWGTVAVFLMAYIGAGAWLYLSDHSAPDGALPDTDGTATGRGPIYTRFPAGPPQAPSRVTVSQTAAPSAAAPQYNRPSAPTPVSASASDTRRAFDTRYSRPNLR